jgi:hypothetical protein
MSTYKTKKEKVHLLGILMVTITSCTTITLGIIIFGIMSLIHGYFEQWINMIYVVTLASVAVIFGVLITAGYIYLQGPRD